MTLFTYRLIRREESALLATQWPPCRGLFPASGRGFWLGEAPLWLLALSIAAFAATLNSTVFHTMIVMALAGYAVRLWVEAARKRSAPATPPRDGQTS